MQSPTRRELAQLMDRAVIGALLLLGLLLFGLQVARADPNPPSIHTTRV